MSEHATHHMHDDSLAAYATVDLQERECQALAALDRLGGKATDRQVAEEMGSEDPNTARPRITNLIKKNVLAETEESPVRDHKTHRLVRQVCKVLPFWP